MTNEKKNRYSKYIPPAIFFGVALIFSLPFLLKWNYIGPRDWELFVTMAAIPVKSILYYFQFPFFNPYLAGGNILFAHPEVAVFSPFFLILLLFGAIGGLKLQVLIVYFLGFWGSWLFSRQLGLSKISSYLVSFVYFGSSYFALHFSAGHMPFTHFCFLPWFLYFLLKANENRKYLLAGAFSIALIILGNGAAIPFLYSCFFSGVFILLYSIEKKNFTYLKFYFFAILAGLLLAAVKFIPMYVELSQFPWAGKPDDFTPLGIIPAAFFSFDQYIFRELGSGFNWTWHEYGAYISPVVVLIAIVGLIYKFRSCRLWLITAVFFFIFGLGSFSDYSLWNLFMNLPGFASIRVPSRAFQFVVLSIAIIAGFGLDYIINHLKDSVSSIKRIAIALVTLILLGNFMVNLPSFNTIDYKLPQKQTFNEEFKHEIGDANDIYRLFQRNRGSLMAPWLSAYKESRGLVSQTNQVAMEYIMSGQLQMISRKYTPNKIEYEIAPTSDGKIIFGIGYDKGWSSSDGRELFEEHGLVATKFSPNDKKIVLTYTTPWFYTGMIISILTLLICLLILFRAEFGNRFKTIFK